MQLATAALEQCFVGGVLYQSVLKRICSLGRDAPCIDQFRVSQTCQSLLQLSFRHHRDCLEQIVGEFAPNDRSDLRNFFCAPEPIQTSHQRIVEGVRNLVCGGFSIAFLEHCARQLLDKQRNSASTLDHLL